jgi:hypothetical protein
MMLNKFKPVINLINNIKILLKYLFNLPLSLYSSLRFIISKNILEKYIMDIYLILELNLIENKNNQLKYHIYKILMFILYPFYVKTFKTDNPIELSNNKIFNIKLFVTNI